MNLLFLKKKSFWLMTQRVGPAIAVGRVGDIWAVF